MSGMVSYNNLTVAPVANLGVQTLVGDGVLHSSATFSRLTGNASYFDATPTMQFAAANVPRWDHDPLTGAPLGLLIEQQSTNVRTYSRMDASWAISNVTQSVGSVAAPDGSMATKITIPTGDGTAKRFVVNPKSQLPDGLMTCQWWVKPDSTTFRYAEFFNYAGPNPGSAIQSVVVDLFDGSIDAIDRGQYPAGQSYALANAWLRYALTYTNGTPAASAYCTLCPARGAITNRHWIGDDSFQYLFASQVEAGGAATSYIATNGAAISRAKDTLTFPAPAAQGTIVLNHDAVSGASLINTNSTDILTSQGAGKIAIAWDASGTSVCYNGGAVTHGAAITWGSDYELLKNANAHIKPNGAPLHLRKLSDAELQAATA